MWGFYRLNTCDGATLLFLGADYGQVEQGAMCAWPLISWISTALRVWIVTLAGSAAIRTKYTKFICRPTFGRASEHILLTPVDSVGAPRDTLQRDARIWINFASLCGSASAAVKCWIGAFSQRLNWNGRAEIDPKECPGNKQGSRETQIYFGNPLNFDGNPETVGKNHGYF